VITENLYSADCSAQLMSPDDRMVNAGGAKSCIGVLAQDRTSSAFQNKSAKTLFGPTRRAL
jgi:hypothetical protein